MQSLKTGDGDGDKDPSPTNIYKHTLNAAQVYPQELTEEKDYQNTQLVTCTVK